MVRILLACLVIIAGAASAQEISSFRAIELDGTTMKITLNDGRVVPREMLVGASFNMGGGVKVRIDAIETDPRDPEIVLHQFAVQPPNSERWGNPCPPDAEGRRDGLMIAGIWDPTGRRTNTEGRSIACTATPQAKCIRFGYKPWKSAADGTSLAEAHRACVQALRGDYCGDGHLALPEGARLDLYDAIGVLKPADAPRLTFEAAWNADGALCVHHSRDPGVISLTGLAERCPRLKDRVGEMCTPEAAPGLGRALLFNKSPQR